MTTSSAGPTTNRVLFENLTLAIGLFRYVSEETSTNYPVFAAGAVLAAIPVVALFLYLQRYIVAGLTAGSVK